MYKNVKKNIIQITTVVLKNMFSGCICLRRISRDETERKINRHVLVLPETRNNLQFNCSACAPS